MSRRQIRQSNDGITVDTPFGTKKYACAKCIKGHRVAKCSLEHAVNRPMLPTNEPGRPSSVWVPTHGSFQHKEEVECDSSGNRLSPEEVDARKKRKRQLQRKSRSSSTTTGFTPVLSAADESEDTPATPATSSGQLDEHYNTVQPAKKSCCHSKNVKQQEVDKPPVLSSKVSLPTELPAPSVKGCNCGDTCTCSFCPEHPNNKTSHDALKQQYADIFAQSHPTQYGLEISAQPLESNTGPSCMGSNPRFTISSTPDLSAENLRRMFPSSQERGGFIMSYPVMWQRSQSPNNAAYPSLQDATTLPTFSQGAYNDMLGHSDQSAAMQMQQQNDYAGAELDRLLSDDVDLNGIDVNDLALAQLDEWDWQVGPSVVSSVSMNDFDQFQGPSNITPPRMHESNEQIAGTMQGGLNAYSSNMRSGTGRQIPALSHHDFLTIDPFMINQHPSTQPRSSPSKQNYVHSNDFNQEPDLAAPHTNATLHGFPYQQPRLPDIYTSMSGERSFQPAMTPPL